MCCGDTGSVKTYIANLLTEWDNAGSDEKRLELIITQKWIQSFGNAVDAYADYRRTGYPILFDPSDGTMAPGGEVQPPVNGNPFVVPQSKVPVLISRDYPQSLPWPISELDVNTKAPPQKTPATFKPFWLLP